jgi:hypothetical protein
LPAEEINKAIPTLKKIRLPKAIAYKHMQLNALHLRPNNSTTALPPMHLLTKNPSHK